ncbi:MAG TPA: hypothetical protein VN578_16700 [Candidatus Binatia bacterium]|jgi:hypothetical protein|nr:hypothetical protein [Candidatus Binatia bacterium]
MIATITAYDASGNVSHRDTREYPDNSLLWEHIGCQQNNQKTARVLAETEVGLAYEVEFSSWTPRRCFAPSRRFHELLRTWGAVFAEPGLRDGGTT